MILLTSSFWKAFFDPNNPKHQNAKKELEIYDREKIIIDQYGFFKIIVWLESNNKKNQVRWFFEYVLGTYNVRLIYLGKEELSKMPLKLQHSEQSQDLFESAVIEYMKNRYNCDCMKY